MRTKTSSQKTDVLDDIGVVYDEVVGDYIGD